MAKFSSDELKRLIGLLPETDPTTLSYHNLLRSIEYLSNMGNELDEFLGCADVIPQPAPDPDYDIPDEPEAPKAEEKPEPVKEKPKAEKKPEPVKEEAKPEPVKEEPKPEPVKAEPKVDAATLRKALTNLRTSKGVDIRSLLSDNFGVDAFSYLPEGKYEECFKLVSDLLAE